MFLSFKNFFKRFFSFNPLNRLEGELGIDSYEEKVKQQQRRLIADIQKRVNKNRVIEAEAKELIDKAQSVKGVAEVRISKYSTMQEKLENLSLGE